MMEYKNRAVHWSDAFRCFKEFMFDRVIEVSLDHTMVVDVEIVNGKILFTTLGVLPVNHTAFAMSATLS